MSIKSRIIFGGASDQTPDAFSLSSFSNQNPGATNVSSVTPSGYDTASQYTVSKTSNGAISTVEVSFDGSNYSSPLTGTITPGQTIYIRTTAGSTFSASDTYTLTIGPAGATTSANGTVSVRAADLVPDAFSFTDVTGAQRSTLTTAGQITVTGFDPNQNITVSITAGTGEIDAGTAALSGTWSSTSKVVTSSNGGYGTSSIVVNVRQTSSSSFSTATNVTISIGGVTDVFTVTTRAMLTAGTVGSGTWTNLSSQSVSTTVNSATHVISGLEPSTSYTITATNGTVAAVTSGTPSTYGASATVTTDGSGNFNASVRCTTSSSYSQAVTVTLGLTGGSLSDTTWTATTMAATDRPPNAFSFVDQTGLSPSTPTDSAPVIVSGFAPSTSYTFTASGGTVAAATYNTTPTTFGASANATSDASGIINIRARATTSANPSTAVNCTVTCNGVSDVFTVTTKAFNPIGVFTDVTGLAPGAGTQTSAQITVTSSFPNYTMTVAGSGGNIDAATSTLPSTYAPSKSITTSGTGSFVVKAQVAASSTYAATTSNTVTAGGVTIDTFSASTADVDLTGNVTAIAAQNNATLSTQYTTSNITVSNLTANAIYTVTPSGSTGFAAAVGTSAVGSFSSSAQNVTTSGTGTFVMQLRVNSGSANNQTTSCSFTVKSSYGSNATVSLTYAGDSSYNVYTPKVGEQVYTSGSGNWTCPTGVTSVCVVCIGGGGGGGPGTTGTPNLAGGGGGGGGLRYWNNIVVTAGNSYSYTVGSAGQGALVNGTATSGGNTSITIGATTYSAYGGTAGNTGGNTYVNGGTGSSGNGGNGGVGNARDGTSNSGGGGGGAGGYAGNGGNGGVASAGAAGAGGSGGGGGGGSATYQGGRGGGCGLSGTGSNGAGGTYTAGGFIGGAGGDGSGGAYGRGGGSGGSQGGSNATSSAGSAGAIRIIWGPGRSFPSSAS